MSNRSYPVCTWRKCARTARATAASAKDGAPAERPTRPLCFRQAGTAIAIADLPRIDIAPQPAL